MLKGSKRHGKRRLVDDIVVTDRTYFGAKQVSCFFCLSTYLELGGCT